VGSSTPSDDLREHGQVRRRLLHSPPSTSDAENAAREEEDHSDPLLDGSCSIQNGWDPTYHVFNYNLHFFQIGALDDDARKLPDGPMRYARRALATRGRLWGNHGYEAA
jgi:hypothetical protein